jgi:hypothetical protein
MSKGSTKSYRKSATRSKSRSRSIRKSSSSKRRLSRKRSSKSSKRRSSVVKMDVIEEGDEAHSSSSKMDVATDYDPASPFVPMDVVEDYETKAPVFDPSFKGLTISFIIMGHGGIKNEVPIETFKPPQNVLHTNILGMRYAGINNLVNRSYEENIDQSLVTKNTDIYHLIEHLNDSFVNFLVQHPDIKERVELIRKRHNIGNNFFGIKSNYTKRNAQKFYQGITEKEEAEHFRHSELKKDGPLVKIYSVLAGNKEEQLKAGESITVGNMHQNITLTELINHVTDFVLSNPRFNEMQREPGVDVNVVDLTCNYTKEHPMIGFIER